MRNLVLLSLLASGLGAGILVTACGDDGKKLVVAPESNAGESCQRTSDCKSGLICSANYCATSGSAGSGSGGANGAGPNLGNEGESCTRRADCAATLSCIEQRCVSAQGQAGGGGAADGPRLGSRGESCRVPNDCTKGLTCVPLDAQTSVGQCDIEDLGFDPNGKACVECTDAAQCCELPSAGVWVTPIGAASPVLVNSCAALAEHMGGDPAVCDATPAAAQNPICFYYKAYCVCAADTWACSNNHCAYAAKCKTNGEFLGGCAARSRLNAVLSSTCTQEKCGPATTCVKTEDCLGKPVSGTSDTCSDAECICANGACYRDCDEDLDCRKGYVCDTTTKLCTFKDSCETDAQCLVQMGQTGFACHDKTCVRICKTDRECSNGGFGAAPLASPLAIDVCSKEGFCDVLHCASDVDCVSSGGARAFCVAAPPNITPIYSSAISD